MHNSIKSKHQNFLSIVIPTKNRFLLVKKVLKSIIDQQIKCLEIIIVDNGDDDCKLNHGVEEFSEFVLIKKTGKLSMPENWEYAIRQASGEYVVIVNDKTIYNPLSLKAIVEILQSKRPSFLTWVLGGSENDKLTVNNTNIQKIDNQKVINYALNCRIDLYQRFAPRGTNSAIRRDILESMWQKHGCLCRPISPDYSLSLFALNECSESLHLSEKLAYIIPNAPSNTEEFKMLKTTCDGYFSTLNISNELIMENVPIKVPTINNLLLDDILRSLQVIIKKPQKINIKEYYLMLISDILISIKQKGPYKDNLKLFKKSLSKEKISFRIDLLYYLLIRFASGYPNRNLKMRDNFVDFLRAFRFLSFN
jgi:glycosyltransferase involved in cell wall biosynthesis